MFMFIDSQMQQGYIWSEVGSAPPSLCMHGRHDHSLSTEVPDGCLYKVVILRHVVIHRTLPPSNPLGVLLWVLPWVSVAVP